MLTVRVRCRCRLHKTQEHSTHAIIDLFLIFLIIAIIVTVVDVGGEDGVRECGEGAVRELAVLTDSLQSSLGSRCYHSWKARNRDLMLDIGRTNPEA